MKKNILILVGLLLLLPLGCSCLVTSELIEVTVPCEDFSEYPNVVLNDFTIGVGDKVTAKLCSNATTGYSWSYTMTGDNAVKEEDHDFEEPDSDMVGAAGTEVWTFEGVEKGTTVIEMKYTRPWEEDAEPTWMYKMTITVE